MRHTKTNCRNFDGVTVSIVDSIITLSRLAKNRITFNKKMPKSIKESLLDLANDEDFKDLITNCRAAQSEEIEKLKNTPSEAAYIKLCEYQSKGLLI